MIATPHRLTLTALAALSMLATPFAFAQQAAFAPAKDATASPGWTTWRSTSNSPSPDKADFDDAQRGFIGKLAPARSNRRRPHQLDLNKYNFLKGEAPDTVNPTCAYRSVEHVHWPVQVTDACIRCADSTSPT